MYKIILSVKYRKAVKKLKKSGQFNNNDLRIVISLLASGKKLPIKYQDHKLTGELRGYRECHIKPNLLLIYMIYKEKLLLILINMGSHSDLFE